MAKLMLSPFVFILISVSAQPDDTLKSYDAETPFTFSAKYPSITPLAYWTSGRNADFSIEFGGLSFTINGKSSSSAHFRNLKGSNAWHFIIIHMKNSDLQIYPDDKEYWIRRSWSDDITIKIKSKERIYWERCTDFFSCDLPGPESNATEFMTGSAPQSTQDSTMELTTLLLLGTSCLLAVIVVGLVVYIIRLKKSTLNEPVANTNEEPIYEEVQLSENFDNSPRSKVTNETINILYGARVPREQRW
ncbi:uncharacterized protein [Macrobrachium rosenbergii]|uniref:uncharacterized protein isoform X1 n=1 Tax=Macrobrachium rosenbergii TaxID=79674 RepID=UPI0034D4C6D3